MLQNIALVKLVAHVLIENIEHFVKKTHRKSLCKFLNEMNKNYTKYRHLRFFFNKIEIGLFKNYSQYCNTEYNRFSIKAI